MSSKVFDSVTSLDSFSVNVDFVKGAFFELMFAAKVNEVSFGLIKFESDFIHPLANSMH